MAHVAVLVDDMFEDVEYTAPVKAFREAGHQVTALGLSKGAKVKGKKEGTAVEIQSEVAESDPSRFDALLIPGGYSPDRLRAHEEPVRFVASFMKSGKPVLAICHAPQILITAQVLKGRRVTGYKSVRQDIVNSGAEFVDQAVVRDGNLISSRGPRDMAQFIAAGLEALDSSGKH
ncbi:MAG: type 1 glutamine amidotransferase domain-containing protein [Chitinispirillaceae bacterium]